MRPGKRFLVVAAVFLSAVSFSREARAERKIGILMFSEEVRYNEAMNGITDRLREAGFSEPNTRLIVENAGANKARAAELVKKYSAEKLDLIITLGHLDDDSRRQGDQGRADRFRGGLRPGGGGNRQGLEKFGQQHHGRDHDLPHDERHRPSDGVPEGRESWPSSTPPAKRTPRRSSRICRRSGTSTASGSSRSP